MILIRARLRRDAAVATLAPLLVPEDADARAGASHRLVWSLFGDSAERRRDFLWREEKPGEFIILAPREPRDAAGLFEIECREFAPRLSPGDRLDFLLRANPTVQPTAPVGGKRPPRSDVVMHALRDLPRGSERAAARPERVIEAGTSWLARQGERKGFAPEPGLRVDGYEAWRVPHGRTSAIRYATLDFAGTLRVEEPASLVAAIVAGFGRAKAFGCGLMLIRRAGR